VKSKIDLSHTGYTSLEVTDCIYTVVLPAKLECLTYKAPYVNFEIPPTFESLTWMKITLEESVTISDFVKWIQACPKLKFLEVLHLGDRLEFGLCEVKQYLLAHTALKEVWIHCAEQKNYTSEEIPMPFWDKR